MEPLIAFQISTFVQLILINTFLPWGILRKILSPSEALNTLFLKANMVVLVCGAPILLFGFSASLFEQTRTQLAILGAFFVFQLLPLLLFKNSVDVAVKRISVIGKQLLPFRYIQWITVTIYISSCVAIALFNSEKVTGILLKVSVLSAACTLLLFLSIKVYRDGKRKTGVGSESRAGLLLSMICLLCIYWVFKEIIFITDSHNLRPLMMSVFLQFATLITLPNVVAEIGRNNIQD